MRRIIRGMSETKMRRGGSEMRCKVDGGRYGVWLFVGGHLSRVGVGIFLFSYFTAHGG